MATFIFRESRWGGCGPVRASTCSTWGEVSLAFQRVLGDQWLHVHLPGKLWQSGLRLEIYDSPNIRRDYFAAVHNARGCLGFIEGDAGFLSMESLERIGRYTLNT